MQVRHIAAGHELLDVLNSEPLRTEWWDDAESEHEPGVAYLMVLARGPHGWLIPAAWAGYRIEDEAGSAVLRCCNNYVRRGFRDRTPELYSVAYRARHRLVVSKFGLPAVTYLVPEPIALHEADGWERDPTPLGSGQSPVNPEHHWQRLRWTPANGRPRSGALPGETSSPT